MVSMNGIVDCSTKGWLMHLVMHALGFYHEHQRTDRNNYIYVNPVNSVLSGSARASLLDVQTGGIIVNSETYDYASITHYHYNAAAVSGKWTIVAMPPEYYSLKSFGHATNPSYSDQSVLSTGDITALQALFPHATAPSVSPASCNNGGTWYNWCICKPGFAGRYCSESLSFISLSFYFIYEFLAYCYHNCENGGYCAINGETGLPGCVCPPNHAGTYCEISGISNNCSTMGPCPWWSTCNPATKSCNCENYPFYGATCSQGNSLKICTEF